MRIRPSDPARARLRTLARSAIAVVCLTGAMACDTSPFTGGPALICAEPGTQCQLQEGPLGVCERAPCPAGVAVPCFQCVPQH